MKFNQTETKLLASVNEEGRIHVDNSSRRRFNAAMSLKKKGVVKEVNRIASSVYGPRRRNGDYVHLSCVSVILEVI